MSEQYSPGNIIDKKYHVDSVIGTGGMGTVLVVTRISDKKIFALKYCFSKDSMLHKRFAREVRIMKDINHKNVIQVVDEQLESEAPYFVMPKAKHALTTILSETSDDEDKGLKIFREICVGLQAIHNSGAVHRDIKPDNVLILEKGKIVISDLGLAKQSDRDTTVLTQTNMVVGTQMYLAPEQRLPAGSREADHRTDIYQLGKTLYQILTAREPVLVDTSQISPGLTHIIRKATQELPENRYESVGELLDDLLNYQQSKDPNTHPAGAFENLITRINDRLGQNEYREEEIDQLLNLLLNQKYDDEPVLFLSLFDRIPDVILNVVMDIKPDRSQGLLKEYVNTLDKIVAGQSFSYAETVASKMNNIWGVPTISAEVKALTLEAVLISSVRLNRFQAMDVFNSMLKNIDDDSDAFAVKEVLNKREREYRSICSNIPSLQLHPVIRSVRDKFCTVDDS